MADDTTQEIRDQGDPTKGLEALVPDLPKFEIEGKKYQMTRLGLKHAMMALRIFAAASNGIMKLQALKGMQSNPMTIALSILSALPYAEGHVKDLIVASLRKVNKDGSLSPISTEELDNPDLFPLESMIDIVEGIGVHPDLKAFLKNIERLQKTPLWEELQNRNMTQQSSSSDN